MALYEITTNRMLRDVEASGAVPHRLPTDEQLARRYGVSRSTIRKALAHLSCCGVVRIAGHTKTAVRFPRETDFFEVDESKPEPREQILDYVVNRLWQAKHDKPMYLTETEMAKKLGCSRQIIREELARLSLYGLIVKQPHRRWKVSDSAEDILMQMVEIRGLFEAHAVKKVLAAPDEAPVWRELRYLHEKLQNLSGDDARMLAQAMKLDKQFHDTLLHHCGNRYMNMFHNLCHLLIEYNSHKQESCRERVLSGLEEHLTILDGLFRRDEEATLSALQVHIARGHAYLEADATH